MKNSLEKRMLNEIAEMFGFKIEWVWCQCCEREVDKDAEYNPETKMCRKCEIEEGLK